VIREDGDTGRRRSFRTGDEVTNELERDWENLDESQRAYVTEVLSQLKKSQESTLLTASRFLDYEEQPVSVRQFFTNPYFIGDMAKELYPKSVDDLVEIFEGGYHEVIISGGIGIGKSTTGVLIILRMLYECICLRNPQRSYGLLRNDKIHFAMLSATAKLAQKVVFEKLVDYLSASPWFQGQGFQAVKEEIRFPKNIRVMGGASGSRNVLGMNIFGAIIDESNFQKRIKKEVSAFGSLIGPKDAAEQSYSSIVTRMKSRFMVSGKLPGILCVLSSANLQDDFTERRLREAADDPKVFYREYALWDMDRGNFAKDTFEVLVGNEMARSRILTKGELREAPTGCRIIEVPMDLYSDFDRDINGSIRDLAGIATVAKEPFIPMRERIGLMVDRSFRHPFGVESWVYGTPLRPIWENLFATDEEGFNIPLANPMAPRHAHFDLSKNRCATGFAVGHISGKRTIRRFENGMRVEREVPVVRLDVCLQILPPEGEEIILSEVVNLVHELIRQGLPIQSISMDSYQSLTLLQQFEREGFLAKMFSSEKPGRYEEFKQAIYDGCVVVYEYPPLLKELRELERDERGRAVKPKNGSKDISDAACCVVTWLGTQALPRDTVAPERGIVEVRDKAGRVVMASDKPAGVTSRRSDTMLWNDEKPRDSSPGDELDLPFIIG